MRPYHLWEIVPFFGYRTVPFFEVTVTVFEPVFWPFSCLTANCTAPKTDHCHFFLNKRKPYHINIAIVSHLWLAPSTAPWTNFGANLLLHQNCDISHITGCPFWFWLFYAKLNYYLLQLLLKLKHLLFKFLILISPYVRTQRFLIKFIFNTI